MTIFSFPPGLILLIFLLTFVAGMAAGYLVCLLSKAFLNEKNHSSLAGLPSGCRLTELFMGVFFVFSLIRFGGDLTGFFMAAGLAVILLELSLVDFAIFEIPDFLIISGIVWWVIFRIIYTFMAGPGSGEKAAAFLIRFIKSSYKNLLSALFFSFSILILSLIMDHILKRESFGGGDIKLIFMTDLYLGFAEGLYALIIACILGLLAFFITRKSKIPFGPCLSLSAFLSILTGKYIIHCYQLLFLL